VTIGAAFLLLQSGALATPSAQTSPRKIAIIASGTAEEDPRILKDATQDEAEKFRALAASRRYETQWVQQSAGQKVSIPLVDSLLSLVGQVKAGKLTPGSQVVLYFFAHGDANEAGTDAHDIYFGNDDHLKLGTITPVLESLRTAGIQVALIDRSCFSGNSIDLSKTGACVISAQNRLNRGHVPLTHSKLKNTYTANDFANHLRRTLESKPGSNLEEAFLSARQSYTDNQFSLDRTTNGAWDYLKALNYTNDLPEISSSEQERLRPIWDHLFFTNYKRDWTQSYSHLACSKEAEAPAEIRRSVDLTVKSAFGDNSFLYDRFQTLRVKRSQWLDEMAHIDSELDGSSLQSIEDLVARKNRREAIIRELARTEDEYQQLLGKVMLIERQLYTEMYRGLQKSGLPGNPCREFKF
jgi:hypothetical protein